MKHKTIIFTILLLMLPLATAIVEDFSAYSNFKEITMDQCATAADEITITNLAPIASFYEVTLSGSAAEYVQTLPPRLSLKAGESKTLLNIITAPCGTKGTKTLVTHIETTTGVEKEIKQEITFKKRNNLKAELELTEIETCPAEPGVFKLNITNSGSFKEQYEISVNKHAEWVTTNSNETIKIEEGLSQEVEVYFETPYDQYGEYEFKMYVEAIKNKLEIEIPVKVNVTKCYDFELVTEQPRYEVCDNEWTSTPIILKNTAKINNSYELDFEGPKWSGLEVERVSNVAGEEETTISLITTPPEHFEGGDYFATITAKTTLGDIERNITVPLYVNECYELGLKSNKEDTVCQGETVLYPVIVENMGVYDQTVHVLAEGTMVSETTVFVAGNNETEAELMFEIPDDKKPGKLYFTASIVGRNDTFAKSKTYLDVVSKEECYMADVEIEKDIETREEEDRRIPIIVRNDGIRVAAYTVSLEAPEWVEADKTEVVLAPGDEEIVYLTAEPTAETEEGRYDVVLGLVKDDVMYKKTIPIEVAGQEATVKENKFLNFLKDYMYYIIAGIVILAILLIVLKIFSNDK